MPAVKIGSICETILIFFPAVSIDSTKGTVLFFGHRQYRKMMTIGLRKDN